MAGQAGRRRDDDPPKNPASDVQVAGPASPEPVKRIGLLSAMNDVNDAALRFLILQLNVVQSSLEFEFLPYDAEDPLITALRSGNPVDREPIRQECDAFHARCFGYLTDAVSGYRAKESPPGHLVVLTTARFGDNYYTLRRHNVSIIALGNWRRWMSPPSILEFALTLTIREAISAVSPAMRSSMHLGTKGCLCDVDLSLNDVRQKVLSSYLCHFCRTSLAGDGQADLIPDIERMLAKTWLGSSADPSSPAGVVSALGHDLFIVKGLKPTTWEALRSTLMQDGAKQLLTLGSSIIGAVAIAILLVLLGLKSGA
jgi:hypothetical protein